MAPWPVPADTTRSILSADSQRSAALLTLAFLFPFGEATLVLPWLLGLYLFEVTAGRREWWARTPVDLPLGGFLLWTLLSAAVSVVPTVAVGSWMLATLAFAVVVQNAIVLFRTSPTFMPRLHRAFALGTLGAAVLSLYLLRAQHLDRAQLPVIGPNALGFGLMVGTFLTLPLFRQSRLWAGVAGVTVFLATAATIGTFSRASLVGLLAGAVCYICLEQRALRWRLIAGAASGVVASLTAALVTPVIRQPLARQLAGHAAYRGPQEALRLLQSALQYLFTPDGYGDRFTIWHGALQIIRARPWLGVGLGVFPFVVYRWDAALPPGMPPHSLYLGLAAETGILGAILFLAVPLVALYRAHRAPSPARWSAMAAMVGMLVAEAREDILFGVHMALGFMVVLAMLLAPTADETHVRAAVHHE